MTQAEKTGARIARLRNERGLTQQQLAQQLGVACDIFQSNHEGELIDLGVQLGLVEKSGSWFSMGETRLGQGRDNAKNYFKEHPEEAQALETEIRANAYKLMSRQSLAAAKAAGRSVEPAESIDVTAEDFED